jgi:type I restriction enzyme S subunit
MASEQSRPRGGDTVSPHQKKAWDLMPYPEYKESGVEWLGKIPSDWKVIRLKRIFREIDRRTTSGEEPLLRMSKSKGLIPYNKISQKPPSANTLIGYKICEPNEIVMNKMQAWNGVFALATTRGLVSPEYTLLHPLFSINAIFFTHLLKTPLMVSQFLVESQGVGSGFLRLYTDRFGAIFVAIPSENDQTICSRFIEKCEHQINNYIRGKRKLIELLNEQKQVIINHAVTRGIDPSVRLKPSGIEWLGDVPEHWKIEKLSSHTLSIGDGLHGTPKYVEESPFHFINGNNLINGIIKITSSTNCIDRDQFEKYKINLDEKTVLLSINGTIGSVALYEDESVILGKSIAYFICRDDISRKYLFYLLQSQALNNFLIQESTGTTILNLSLASLRNLKIPLPSFNEQQKIIDYLDSIVAIFSILIENELEQIHLIREYHARLVSDVVTGKVDVRGIEIVDAASLVDDEDIDLDDNDEDNDEDNVDDGDDDRDDE